MNKQPTTNLSTYRSMDWIEEVDKTMSENKVDSVNRNQEVHAFLRKKVENFFDFKVHLPVIVLNLFVHHHIRRPKSLCQNIPDLLDRLMDVEHVRQGLLEIYKQVETCQQACKSDAPNMCLLAANDEIEITTHSSDALDTAYRTLYSETVIGYSKLHIFYLYTGPESHLLPTYMEKFYPGLRSEGTGASSQKAFHCDFSKEEYARLNEAQQESLDFIESADKWEQDRHAFWNDKGLPNDTFFGHEKNVTFHTDFEKAFDPLADVDMLIESTRWCLNHVERMEDTLKRVFSQ